MSRGLLHLRDTSWGKGSSPGSAVSPYSPCKHGKRTGRRSFCSSSCPTRKYVALMRSGYSSKVIEDGEKERTRDSKTRVQDLSGGKRRQNWEGHSHKVPSSARKPAVVELYKALVLAPAGRRLGICRPPPARFLLTLRISRQDDPRQNENIRNGAELHDYATCKWSFPCLSRTFPSMINAGKGGRGRRGDHDWLMKYALGIGHRIRKLAGHEHVRAYLSHRTQTRVRQARDPAWGGTSADAL
jgi:hypothetical protein